MEYNNKLVLISYIESGNNQMDQTEYQIISFITIDDDKVVYGENTIFRWGYPSELGDDEKEELGLTCEYIGKKAWVTPDTPEDLRELAELKVIDNKIQRDGDEVDVQLVDVDKLTREQQAILIPPRRDSNFKF